MPDLKIGPLILQIFEYLVIHLQVHFKDYVKYWIQTIEEHPCLMLGKVCLVAILSFFVIELLDEALIFFEDGASHY